MSKIAELVKFVELQKSLPGRMHAAARAVEDAERHLAQLLTLRAAGHSVKGNEIAVARMAQSRALRDAEDLRRIQSALPAMLPLGGDASLAEGERAANQTWPGARKVQCA